MPPAPPSAPSPGAALAASRLAWPRRPRRFHPRPPRRPRPGCPDAPAHPQCPAADPGRGLPPRPASPEPLSGAYCPKIRWPRPSLRRGASPTPTSSGLGGLRTTCQPRRAGLICVGVIVGSTPSGVILWRIINVCTPFTICQESGRVHCYTCLPHLVLRPTLMGPVVCMYVLFPFYR